jgi:hypothetical protein
VNCEQVRGLIHDFWDGSLGPEEHERVQRHLESCAACSESRDRIGRLEALLKDAVRVPEAPDRSWADQQGRILAALDRSAPQEREVSRRAIFKIALVAAIVLVAGIGFLLWKAAPPRSASVNVAEKPFPVIPEPRIPEAVPPPQETPPPVSPAPLPPPPQALPSRSVAAIFPGSPEHLKQMADDSVDVGLAETATERVVIFLSAADSRLVELRLVMGKDDQLATELVQAFTLLLREGIARVLRDREESPEDLGVARRIALQRARKQEDSITQLSSTASGRLKITLLEAIEATRELAKP